MGMEELERELIEGIDKSPKEMLDYQGQMIVEITRRAQGTPVYKGRIREVRDIDELVELPLTFYDQIASAFKLHGVENCLLSSYEVRVQTAGTTGVPKTYYYSSGDIEGFGLIGGRCGWLLGLRPADLALSFSAPPPYISGILTRSAARKARIRILDTPVTRPIQLIKGLKRISRVRERIKAIYGFPSILDMVGRIATEPERFRLRARQKIRQRLGPLGGIASRFLLNMDYERLGQIIEGVGMVCSAGEPLKPYEERLESYYPSARFHEAYGSTELGIGMMQLLPDAGLNPMLDWFIPMLASPEEVVRARRDPSYRPTLIPYWKWRAGQRGELIITRDGQCLPLINFPTGDLVEVIDPSKTIRLELSYTELNVSLPEVRTLGRSVEFLPPEMDVDEMLIFGVARVYPSEIKEELHKIQGLRVRHHTLFVHTPTPSRPLPKWRVEVIPEQAVSNKGELKERIRRRLIDRTELHETLGPLGLGYSREYIEGLFEVEILEPEAYRRIEEEVERRLREGKPLGQIKPKHVYFVREE
jgi:phenylacetate-coenzyme A ligase PaaK-like adenylate-forming protein